MHPHSIPYDKAPPGSVFVSNEWIDENTLMAKGGVDRSRRLTLDVGQSFVLIRSPNPAGHAEILVGDNMFFVNPKWLYESEDSITHPKFLVVEPKNLLIGKKIVFTGGLCAKRKAIVKACEIQGGEVTGQISSKSSMLVTEFPNLPTVKQRMAKELGIPIVSELDFFTMAKISTIGPKTKR